MKADLAPWHLQKGLSMVSTGANIEEPLGFWSSGLGISLLGAVRIGSRHCTWPDVVVEEIASKTVAVLLLGTWQCWPTSAQADEHGGVAAKLRAAPSRSPIEQRVLEPNLNLV